MPEHSKGKKNRKIGRNKAKCELYAKKHMRTKNNPLRKPRDPERTPHKNEHRKKVDKDTAVRPVLENVYDRREREHRNGLS